MQTELHVQLRPGVVGLPDDILADFPYGEGQRIISFSQGVLVIDLAGAEDTSTEQEWYLNGNEDVQSFFVVEDD